MKTSSRRSDRCGLTTGIQVVEQVVRPIGEDAATPQGLTALPDENILDKFITLPSNGYLD